jgi:hypothetical protein
MMNNIRVVAVDIAATAVVGCIYDLSIPDLSLEDYTLNNRYRDHILMGLTPEAFMKASPIFSAGSTARCKELGVQNPLNEIIRRAGATPAPVEDIVDQHWRQITAVADRLMEVGHMSDSEVREIMNSIKN